MKVDFAIKEFKDEKKLMGVTDGTLKGYEFLFSVFSDWLAEEGITELDEVSARVIKKFLSHCKTERGNNNTSLNTKLKLFKTFFNFLVEEKLLEDNPVSGIKRFREDVTIQSFSDSEIQQMLSHLRRNKRKQSFHATRDYTLFVLLLGTGMRAGESINLKWTDINFKSGYITVFGKTRRQETLPMSEKVAKELSWLKQYYEEKFLKASPYVFVNQQNKPLTVNAVKCFFKKLAKVMEFPESRCSAHTLRHTYSRIFIENGGDVSILSRILRHQDLQTTSRYLNFFSNKLADDNTKYNALNGFKI